MSSAGEGDDLRMYALGNAKAYNTLRPRKGLANPFAGIKMESEIEPVLARLSSPDQLADKHHNVGLGQKTDLLQEAGTPTERGPRPL